AGQSARGVDRELLFENYEAAPLELASEGGSDPAVGSRSSSSGNGDLFEQSPGIAHVSGRILERSSGMGVTRLARVLSAGGVACRLIPRVCRSSSPGSTALEMAVSWLTRPAATSSTRC